MNQQPHDEASGSAPPARPGRSFLKKAGLSIGGMVLLTLIAIVLWGVVIEPRFLLDVQRQDAEVRNLPIEWDGERVAMLADFQVGMWLDNDGMVAKAVERAIALDVTAVLIAGDFVYGTDSGRIDRAMQLVRPLTEAGIPTIAVLGNHDYEMATAEDARQPGVAEEVERRLVELGVQVLENESTRIEHPGGGPPLHVVGLGSEWAGNSHPREAFAALAPESARLVLMHNPVSFRDLPPHSGSLSLAAHTHGGQLRIPFTRSASWLDIARGREVVADGWGEQGLGAAGNRIYVNRGIGFSIIPARFRCRPELTVFTLRRAAGDVPARGPDKIGDAGARTVTLVERAQEFRSLLSTGAYDSARTMMSPNARRWFAPREGEGLPWIIGETAGGAWARWDEHFGSEGEVVEWAEDDASATAIVRETNDYYRLLERGPQLNRLTYHFDSDGLIEGLVIGSAGERDMGLTQQFQAWARENRPEEIAELMPGGDIDPSYPERFRRLLNEWRQATGRVPIE